MRRRLIFAISGWMVAGAAPSADATIGFDETPSPMPLVLIDETMVEEERAEWRLPTESIAADASPEDALRLKVKVRPNRTMGRMSLSF